MYFFFSYYYYFFLVLTMFYTPVTLPLVMGLGFQCYGDTKGAFQQMYPASAANTAGIYNLQTCLITGSACPTFCFFASL